ncbi:MAG: SAM-dependent methyltransferase [Opitutales bacterium]
MKGSTEVEVGPEVLAALREEFSSGESRLSLEAFIRCVLYHPRIGYYRQQRQRVGRNPETDFYTASSLGRLFPRLVLASVQDLLGDDLHDYTFVEAGPESRLGILGELDEHPFKEVRLIRPGEPFELPRKTVLFSNELFDAQPFRRFVSHSGRWREAGVGLGESTIHWTTLDPGDTLPELPPGAPEGYTIDWPEAAHRLLGDIAGQDWQGLFLAFDYGLDRAILFNERPEGTGRTYSGHTMGSDLLADPGNIDITCHIVWDVMEEILTKAGFKSVSLLRQEAFFMRHGQTVIREILQSGPAGFSPEKQTLMELVHPANLGHKFQVLAALRGES